MLIWKLTFTSDEPRSKCPPSLAEMQHRCTASPRPLLNMKSTPTRHSPALILSIKTWLWLQQRWPGGPHSPSPRSLLPFFPPGIMTWNMFSWQELRQHHRLSVFYLPAHVGLLFLWLKAEDSSIVKGKSLCPTESNIIETDVSLAVIFWVYLLSGFFYPRIQIILIKQERGFQKK